jgi:hypothetical protein
MAVDDDGPPQMSGALPDNVPSPIDPNSQIQPNPDHIYTENVSTDQNHENTKLPSLVDGQTQNTAPLGDPQAREDNEFQPKPIRRTETAATTKSTKKKKKKRKAVRKHSLDDVLRHAVNGSVFDRPETRIHLPDSRPSTARSRTSYNENSKTSLEVIIDKGNPPIDTEISLPATIPLPVSRPESVREPERLSRRLDGQDAFSPPPPAPPPQHRGPYYTYQLPGPPVQTLPIYDYDAILRRAAETFQHLRGGRITAETRHSFLQEKFSCIDMPPPNAMRRPVIVEGSTQYKEHFEASLETVPESVKQRLIVVEDLSPEIILGLGRHFGVSPELFEEHLINSGYEGADYSDLPASTWPTAGMKKSHVSVKWHRPVLRLPVPEAPFSKQDLRDLLDPEIGRLEYTLHSSDDLGVFSTETNIFRSEWELWTDPKITARDKRLCGWEERASVWIKDLPNGCQIGKFSTTTPNVEISNSLLISDTVARSTSNLG